MREKERGRKSGSSCDEVGEAKGKIIEIVKGPSASSAAEGKRSKTGELRHCRSHIRARVLSNIRAAS